jgi:hypothetical protein
MAIRIVVANFHTTTTLALRVVLSRCPTTQEDFIL